MKIAVVIGGSIVGMCAARTLAPVTDRAMLAVVAHELRQPVAT